ncbi:MAG: hypothetical protein FJW36_00155 [Acidobacteria bacterium]|nr:hypothetical protein [Acidobacteriota bacterium]
MAQKNRHAVETLQRGTQSKNCNWGLEYQLGADAPLEHVRKALALSRINILYSMHLLQTGNRTVGIRSIAAGIRFSHDVSKGGPLMAAVAAKTLLTSHLRLVAFAQVEKPLSSDEEKIISSAITEIGPGGLDWEMALVRDFEIYSKATSTSLSDLLEQYRQALRNPDQMPRLRQTLANAPKAVSSKIPNPQQVLDQKQELDNLLRTTRSALKP